jgi:hypothetical protein
MPNLLPITYLNRYNKQDARNLIFKIIFDKYFEYRTIIGLAGPDGNSYCKEFYDRGFKQIEIWENHQPTADKQAKEIKHPVRMRFGDIINANPNRVKTFYDLDFTFTVRRHHPHIIKFKDNFIMTFSRRLKGGTDRIIEEFFFVRNETIFSIVDRIKDGISYKSIRTTRGRYMYVPYYDTTPMCCIAKL